MPVPDRAVLCDHAGMMRALYRKRISLPSLVLAVTVAGCEAPAPPAAPVGPVSDRELRALQEVEALRHSLQQHELEQQRVDRLLAPGQVPDR